MNSTARQAIRFFIVHFLWAALMALVMSFSTGFSLLVFVLPGLVMGVVFVHLHKELVVVKQKRVLLIFVFSIAYVIAIFLPLHLLLLTQEKVDLEYIALYLTKGFAGTGTLLWLTGAVLNRHFPWHWYLILMIAGVGLSLVFWQRSFTMDSDGSLGLFIGFAPWQGVMGMLLGVAVRKTFPARATGE